MKFNINISCGILNSWNVGFCNKWKFFTVKKKKKKKKKKDSTRMYYCIYNSWRDIWLKLYVII